MILLGCWEAIVKPAATFDFRLRAKVIHQRASRRPDANIQVLAASKAPL